MVTIEKLVPGIVRALLEDGVRHDEHYRESLLETSPWVFRCACGASLDKNGRAWEQKDYRLASLVVGIVKKQAVVDADQFFRWHQRARRCSECERRGLVENDPRHNFNHQEWELNAVSDFNISQTAYEELKRRVG